MSRKRVPPATRTTIYLSNTVARRAKIYAARHGTSVTALVEKGLRAQLRERPAEVAGKNAPTPSIPG
jgi:hypothetical protein